MAAARIGDAGERPTTLSIDVGGSGLKAAALDPAGLRLTDRVRIPTPSPAPPEVLLDALEELASRIPDCDRVSVGFPGAVRDGRVITAPNLGEAAVWRGFPLAEELGRRLRRPTRVLNDAEVQGLAVIEGRGLEMVITLGTGFGTGLFLDGRPAPHLELAHHPLRGGETYEEQLGDRALKRAGRRKWNRRLERAIATLRALVNFDRLYLGGGNARKVDFTPHEDTTIVSNKAGVLGGVALWRQPGDPLPPRQAEALDPDAESGKVLHEGRRERDEA